LIFDWLFHNNQLKESRSRGRAVFSLFIIDENSNLKKTFLQFSFLFLSKEKFSHKTPTDVSLE
jgi:hypothetical protein